MDTHRRVQNWVEQQRAYLPTYTAAHLVNEPQLGTPSEPLKNDDFGFSTPVLRPRVPGNRATQSQRTMHAGPSKSRIHRAESRLIPRRHLSPASSAEALAKVQHAPSNKDKDKDKLKSKRKKALTPDDTDSERAARLADRRERKRKKHAIVSPAREQDDPTAARRKGKANDQKIKKPTSLALLYGFSATNVTKDRLTLKPAPALGVFNKGKASTKKKVTTAKKSSSRNEYFSEFAFLNKRGERAVDHSPKMDDDSVYSSISSLSNHPISRAVGTTSHSKNNSGKRTKTPAVKALKTTRRTGTGSEVWDIEMQSKLPSSARDVSSNPGTQDSPVVLDPRGMEWAALVNTPKKHEESCDKIRTPSLSVTQIRPMACSSPLAVLDLDDGSGAPYTMGDPSIHPCHSASQVGRRAADIQLSDLCLVTSKYFTGPSPAPVRGFAADLTQTSRMNGGNDVLDPQIPSEVVVHAALDVRTSCSAASPVSSPQPKAEPQTRYDMAPLECLSDGPAYDNRYAHVDVPWELAGQRYRGCSESYVVEDAVEYHQSATWDWSRSMDGVDGDGVENLQETYDQPSAWTYEDHPGEQDEDQFFEDWIDMDGATQGDVVYDSFDLSDEVQDMPGFLEGRALLLGVTPDHEGRACVSGLTQAEMDVASRLQDHWRPLRL